MSFSITLEWVDKTEHSFIDDFADRPKYQAADTPMHEYRIHHKKETPLTKPDGHYTLTLHYPSHSTAFNVKGSPFDSEAQAKAAACEHAAESIADTANNLSKCRDIIEDLRKDLSNKEEQIESLQNEVEAAEDGTKDAAEHIRERITLFLNTPVDALNEFLREQQVAEVREVA